MHRQLALLMALWLVPLAALRAEEKPTIAPSAKRAPAKATSAFGDTPAGKPFIYKQSAGKPREMEIYFPPNHDPAKTKVPGLILFHGGGWSSGTRAQFRAACQYFASRGLVTATAEYRMLSKAEAQALPKGESHKRVCITDAKSAIRWLKQHAGELGIDPARIITGGGSAGGHIAVLATTNPGLNDPADPQNIDTSVVAYLLFNPAFAPADKQDAEVDVLQQVKPTLPPAIVFFGTKDSWKPGWDALHAQLTTAGNKTTNLQLAQGQAHGFFNREPWLSVTLIAADRFLVQRGLMSGEPMRSAPATGEKLLPSQ
ncbi:MAG TPA: alpha/beta hydrolase [Pirellulaceae bacterium]|nr:alpha/beta hydrolase [Pirellulaceae bacterium]